MTGGRGATAVSRRARSRASFASFGATFRPMRLRRVVVVCGVVLAAAVGEAGATVPPISCGPLTVGKRHYLIKADQIGCAFAKSSAKVYLVSHRAPSGYRCQNYKNTALTFRCTRGIRVFFAIRR